MASRRSPRKASSPRQTRGVPENEAPQRFFESNPASSVTANAVSSTRERTPNRFDVVSVGLGLGVVSFLIVMRHSAFLGLTLLSVAFFLVASGLGTD